MTAPLTRRLLLRHAALACGGAVLAGPFAALLGGRAQAADAGYGPLAPVLDDATGLPLLRLPAGFSYRSFGWAGDPLAGGLPTPGYHDGMAVVRTEGDRIWLVRNHEVRGRGTSFGPPALTYDPAAPGGVTTLVFDGKAGRLESARASLAGTTTNCGGGPTPWHTWLSCEEAVDEFDKPHGFVFEVPAEGAASTEPLTALGRFVHEAAAVDPASGLLYLTEDRVTSGFYRFTPATRGDLRRGGRLEMLRVADRPAADLRGRATAGTTFAVGWVPIADPLRAHTPGTTDSLGVFSQGREQGGATFARLEGCWHAGDRVVFTSTNGGGAQAGQVWEYRPGAESLRLLYESPAPATLDMPDNLTIAPRGGIVLCEDGTAGVQRLQGLTPDGRPFVFAENAIVLDGKPNGLTGDFRRQEWAGATFHGRWLFVNIQEPGVTFAITGPWERGAF